MDTLALITTYEVLRLKSIRSTARFMKRPHTSVAAALSRTESELARRLVRKAGTGLSITLEGRRLLNDLQQIAEASRKLASLSRHWRDQTESVKHFSVSFLTLGRFSHIARTGSIRRAAREMGVGQPQLSRQISGLEQEMGRQLFSRMDDGVTLTEEGTEVFATVEVLIETWQRISQSADDDFRKDISTCRLGSMIPVGFESETASRLASLVSRWQSEWPHAPLFISSTIAEELLRGLQSGLYDVALLDTENISGEFERKVIWRTELSLVGQESLFKSGPKDLKSLLLSRPIAVPSSKSGLRQQFIAFLAANLTDEERHKQTLVEIDSLPILLNLVMEHGYFAVLPRTSFARMSIPLSSLALDKKFEIAMTLVWPPTVSSRRIAQRVLDMI